MMERIKFKFKNNCEIEYWFEVFVLALSGGVTP